MQMEEAPDLRHVLEEAVEEFRRRASDELDQLLVRKRAEEESNRARKKRKIEEGHAALAEALESTAAQVPGVPGELFLSDIVRLRIKSQTLNVHSSVLQKWPYFATLLSGRWSEADILDLNLPEPCSLSDFLVLLEYMYSAHKVPFVFQNLGSALRVTLVASMLLVDDHMLADIAAGLSRTVTSKSDAIAFKTFVEAHQLPAVFASIVSMEEGVPMDIEAFKKMVASAASVNDAQKQRVAQKIIAAQVINGRRYEQAIREALVLPETGCTCFFPRAAGGGWWFELMLKHAGAGHITEVLHKLSNLIFCCSSCTGRATLQRSWQPSFYAHAQASRNPDIAALGISGLNAVLSFGHSTEGLQALCKILRQPGSSAISKKLEESHPSVLGKLLSQEVLSAISNQKPIIAKMCTDPGSLRSWATVELLQALQCESRRTVCYVLAADMAQLTPDVVQVLEATLASDT
eukprot:TRINITY_DN58361_c0_g1_i1.p1 TRINITY_DN58361_c0_g1~~TRINITY_DN58361_c0_g1_i1.p1  ORF type:complete len:462 (-),score=90.92 TRINITY_DN58361_c0_g1_i1:158-1543(-)